MLTEEQLQAVKCAYLDLRGVLQCLEEGIGEPDGVDTRAIQSTVEEMEKAFKDVVDLQQVEEAITADKEVPEVVLLTEEQREEYIKNNGQLCPFCSSNDLSTDKLSINDRVITEEIECLNCGEEWQDSYTLTGITQKQKL